MRVTKPLCNAAFILSLIFVGSLGARPGSAEDQAFEESEAPVESVQVCFDSYDCTALVEHCLNRRCERTTRRCHFNHECGGADTCQRGVCRR